MSGISDEGICPNCGSDKYAIYHDWKPFNLDSSQCYDCGFHTMTTVGFDSLKDLNLERDDIEEWGDEELKPLKELREQTQWAKDNMKYYITEEKD